MGFSIKVLNFIIKIEYFLNNKWLEVERYDCYHGFIHKDILDKYGKKKIVASKKNIKGNYKSGK